MNFNKVNKTPILGLGISAFDRLGPEQYLNNYKILSLNESEWTSSFPDLKNKVSSLTEILPNTILSKKNTERALEEINWEKVKKNIEFKSILTYRPVKTQRKFEDETKIKVLNNSYETFIILENKANFRKFIKDKKIFPDYLISKSSDLSPLSYKFLFNKFGKFVIQDSQLSAGKGTFFISNSRQFTDTLEQLKKIKSKKIVISKYIKGKPASIQVCITKFGTFCLPLQLQILSQSALINKDEPTASSFNGGQWSTSDFTTEENEEAKKIAIDIAKKLSSIGYKGIFGIDFLITEKSEIFVVEVNARLTGMTPIIALIQESLQQIPLQMLHILEHSGQTYELGQNEIEQLKNYTWSSQDYSYLVLFNNNKKSLIGRKSVMPGLYELNNLKNSLKHISVKRQLSSLKKENQALILDFPKKNTSVPVNKRLGRVIIKGKALDENGNLLPKIKIMVEKIRSLMGTK